jgi:hypothetical protein
VKRFIQAFRGRMLTTWPMLAEACHLLPERTQIRFLRWAAAGGLSVVELHETALSTIAGWKEKYRNAMDLADASLLWVAGDVPGASHDRGRGRSRLRFLRQCGLFAPRAEVRCRAVHEVSIDLHAGPLHHFRPLCGFFPDVLGESFG